MDLQKVQSDLNALETDTSLTEAANLGARAKALDFITLVDEIVRMRSRTEDLTALQQQAASLKQRLEAINEHVFRRLRADIQSGTTTPRELRQQFDQCTAYAANEKGQAHVGYDGLDILVNGLLQVDLHPTEAQARDPEMIHLEFTPARAVLDLIDNVGLTQADIFYDLGSGLGQVAILVNLLTGIKAKGVEVEPAYCEYARKCVRDLGLSSIDFINVDAREADCSDGTIFFMFTPFKGKLLQTVLDKLQHEARKRTIKICTYGPCTLHVSSQPWLRSVGANASHEFKLAIFNSI